MKITFRWIIFLSDLSLFVINIVTWFDVSCWVLFFVVGFYLLVAGFYVFCCWVIYYVCCCVGWLCYVHWVGFILSWFNISPIIHPEEVKWLSSSNNKQLFLKARVSIFIQKFKFETDMPYLLNLTIERNFSCKICKKSKKK